MDGALRQSGEPAEERMRQVGHPVSALAGPYGHPLHPMLVTVPVGAWFASLVFDLASRVVPDPGSLARGSLWLIGIGVAGALVAATAGVLDLFAIPARTPAQGTALRHMSLNLTVTAAYAADFLLRWRDQAQPGPVAAGPILLSAVSFAGLAAAGYLGGKLAYQYGVRVAGAATQAEGYRTGQEPGPAHPAQGRQPIPQPAPRPRQPAPQSAPRQSAPRQSAPRQPAPRQPAPRQPAPRQPAPQSEPRQPARQSASSEPWPNTRGEPPATPPRLPRASPPPRDDGLLHT